MLQNEKHFFLVNPKERPFLECHKFQGGSLVRCAPLTLSLSLSLSLYVDIEAIIGTWIDWYGQGPSEDPPSSFWVLASPLPRTVVELFVRPQRCSFPPKAHVADWPD